MDTVPEMVMDTVPVTDTVHEGDTVPVTDTVHEGDTVKEVDTVPDELPVTEGILEIDGETLPEIDCEREVVTEVLTVERVGDCPCTPASASTTSSKIIIIAVFILTLYDLTRPLTKQIGRAHV